MPLSKLAGNRCHYNVQWIRACVLTKNMSYLQHLPLSPVYLLGGNGCWNWTSNKCLCCEPSVWYQSREEKEKEREHTAEYERVGVHRKRHREWGDPLQSLSAEAKLLENWSPKNFCWKLFVGKVTQSKKLEWSRKKVKKKLHSDLQAVQMAFNGPPTQEQVLDRPQSDCHTGETCLNIRPELMIHLYLIPEKISG